MGTIHQDFVIQKSHFNCLYDCYFSNRKTSLIMASNTAIHFNDLGLTKESSFVSKFSISLTHFTQRRQISHKDRLLQGHKPRERQQQTNRNTHFQNTKIQNKDPATVRIRRKKNYLLRFSHKEQTSNKVYRFSDK